MSANLAREKARFQGLGDAARLAATRTLAPVVGVDFTMTGWTGRSREALAAQWTDGVHFDWVEVFRRHRDPDRLDVALWSPGDRLSALVLGLTTGAAVELRFFEGDPRPDCPLKGRRTLIILECAANYAQARGRTELRIQPINERLETLYKLEYGFTLETPRRGAHYYRKVV